MCECNNKILENIDKKLSVLIGQTKGINIDIIDVSEYLSKGIMDKQEARERNKKEENHLNVEWVVNNYGELGVKVGDDYYFLYKGRSLIYKYPGEDENNGIKRMYVRPVGKREFGECCYPLNFKKMDLTDSDLWIELPSSNHPDAT